MSRRANDDGAFDELVGAINEGKQALRAGSLLVHTTVELPEPPPLFSARRIRALRQQLGMTRVVFARALAVSPATLLKWEQGENAPSRTARRLLEIAERHPQVFAPAPAARPA